MAQEFTRGNVTRAMADAMDAADADDKAAGRTWAADDTFAAKVVKCWEGVMVMAFMAPACTVAEVVTMCDDMAENNTGPDPEEWDNEMGDAWRAVAAEMRRRFM